MRRKFVTGFVCPLREIHPLSYSQIFLVDKLKLESVHLSNPYWLI